MIATDMVERMARGAHAAARERYPLLEPWERLSAERRAYQCAMIARALAQLTARDVLGLAACVPEVMVLPAEPSPFALAELQEAAIGDSGTVADARRRYRSLLAVAARPLQERTSLPRSAPADPA
ncbi:MAG: hypothetical protein B7X99_18210 [Rhizobiales bacterium 17-65-6]|nr:MAG: hypothetical protein B7Z30_10100 [Rhizobiales bacterium 12-68-15]OYX89023.1 MAG: hypothetical protein B7Y84_06775 [Azorhizobium sp. 32-67-21]OYZ89995.1 MAG: hypothetical protein B7X99_18210 [Rhizobiales bacterium 17-65-6]